MIRFLMRYLLISLLCAGSAFADTIMFNGEPITVRQNGQFVTVDGQTYSISQEGHYINTIGPRTDYVPNLSPEQAAAYLNSTPEGRAASAKFDKDLKAASAKFDKDLKDLEINLHRGKK